MKVILKFRCYFHLPLNHLFARPSTPYPTLQPTTLNSNCNLPLILPNGIHLLPHPSVLTPFLCILRYSYVALFHPHPLISLFIVRLSLLILIRFSHFAFSCSHAQTNTYHVLTFQLQHLSLIHI